MNALDAILAVQAERFDALDAEVARRVRDPQQVPAALLGHVAWSRGLDYWDSGWPLATKRALALSTPANLRRRGTRAAIDSALAAFGADITVEEWWETTPEGAPGTGTVTASQSGAVGSSLDAQALIAELLSRESRKSLHWTIALALGGSAELGVIGAARATVLCQCTGGVTGA